MMVHKNLTKDFWFSKRHIVLIRSKGCTKQNCDVSVTLYLNSVFVPTLLRHMIFRFGKLSYPCNVK